MTIPASPRDPIIDDLHAVIAKLASRIVERPDWLRDVSPADRAFIGKLFELAVLIHTGRSDVIH